MTAPRLRLILRRWPPGMSEQMRELTSSCTIGRGEQAQWRLADPEQLLSRPHCEVRPTPAGWLVIDMSGNGTFLNGATEAIGRGNTRPLADGDRLRLGDYEIEARLEVPSPAAQPESAADRTGWTAGSWGEAPKPDPRAAPAAPQPAPGRTGWTSVSWGASPKAEPPAAAVSAPPDAAPTPIPDDNWGVSQVDLHDRATLAAPEPAAPEPAAPPPPPNPAPGPADDLLAALLRGAAVPDCRPAKSALAMEQAGRALRALVAGLHAIQSSRALMKREFRIGKSAMLGRHGGNPLRLILDEPQALRALLESSYPADQAVTDVLDRVRLHELALLKAMRDAVTTLLGTLSPERVLAAVDRSALDPVLPAQRKARAWDAFEKLYRRTLDALDDDFDSAFGRDFARTYEKVVEDQASQHRQKPCP